MALGIIGFVVALLVSVLLHEAGHMLTAKAFGMKVTQYFAGFGPTLWSFRRGETEYGVKAIPAGGFVKITGQVSMDDVEPGDERRAMVNKPGWQRFVVLVAGSVTHFVIALVLFAVIFVIWPSPNGKVDIAGVEQCLKATAGATCAPGAPAAPAAGKLQQGDVVLAVDGKQLTGGPDQLSQLIRAAGTTPVSLDVRRGSGEQTVVVTPANFQGRAMVGIELQSALAHHSVPGAIGESFSTFATGVVQTGTVLQSLPSELAHVFSAQNRSITDGSSGGVISVVGAGRLSGEALASGGFAGFLGIIAAFNLSIGLFNLLPLLPLDGGHIAVLAFERARAGIARLLGRPRPGHVDYNRLAPLTLGFVSLLLVVGVLALAGDIINPVVNPF